MSIREMWCSRAAVAAVSEHREVATAWQLIVNRFSRGTSKSLCYLNDPEKNDSLQETFQQAIPSKYIETNTRAGELRFPRNIM